MGAITKSSSFENYNPETDSRMVSLSELHRFHNHPFKVERNLELFELMESIRLEGVLVPLIVRSNPYGEGYEILSGHRRCEAAQWAGLQKVPVVIRELDDDQAVIIMIDSNLQREHLKPSEKAFAYKMKLEAMKRQAGRKPSKIMSQVGTHFSVTQKSAALSEGSELRSDELLARQVGESRNQVARYVRLTYLIPKILQMVDESRLAMTSAVELSYLKEEEQYELHAVMELEQTIPSLSQANRLKRKSQQGILDMDLIYSIMEEMKPNQQEQIRIPLDRVRKYIPESYTPAQQIKLIETLLQAWAKESKGKRRMRS